MADTNLTALQTAMTTANGLANLILVSPEDVGYQPQNPNLKSSSDQQPSPPKFLFNFEDQNKVTLESDITDHFVEDNTAIQDQVALKPEMVFVSGFIGELNNVVPPILKALKIAAEKLTILSAYAPELSVSAQDAYNTALQLYQTAQNVSNSAVSAWRSINGTNGISVIDSNGIAVRPNQNKQQVAYQMFYGYWRSRTLFTIQTPWAVHKNMVIKNLEGIQDEDRTVSNFRITFKQMRFAETTVVTSQQGVIYDNTKFQGRLFNQAAPVTDLGSSTPIDSIALSEVLNA